MNASLRDWLALIRLPAIFSAPADVIGAMGLAAAIEVDIEIIQMLQLMLVALLLYMSGMITNDIFDLDVDAVERPERPLPSGRIRATHAWRVALAMQLAALLIAVGVSPTTGVCAAILCALTYVYNGVTKATPVGPLVMGLCRGANVCLGLSVLPSFGLANQSWLMVLTIVLYIWSVTLVSRYEVFEPGQDLKARVAVTRLRLSGFLAFIYFPLSCHAIWWTCLILGMLPLWLNVSGFRFRQLDGPVKLEVIRGLQGILVVYISLCVVMGGYLFALSLLGLLLLGRQAGRWFYAT
ncbi:MAG: UbiA family prenyltransferase [Bradymonadia bacterium]